MILVIKGLQPVFQISCNFYMFATAFCEHAWCLLINHFRSRFLRKVLPYCKSCRKSINILFFVRINKDDVDRKAWRFLQRKANCACYLFVLRSWCIHSGSHHFLWVDSLSWLTTPWDQNIHVHFEESHVYWLFTRRFPSILSLFDKWKKLLQKCRRMLSCQVRFCHLLWKYQP